MFELQFFFTRAFSRVLFVVRYIKKRKKFTVQSSRNYGRWYSSKKEEVYCFDNGAAGPWGRDIWRSRSCTRAKKCFFDQHHHHRRRPYSRVNRKVVAIVIPFGLFVFFCFFLTTVSEEIRTTCSPRRRDVQRPTRSPRGRVSIGPRRELFALTTCCTPPEKTTRVCSFTCCLFSKETDGSPLRVGYGFFFFAFFCLLS